MILPVSGPSSLWVKLGPREWVLQNHRLNPYDRAQRVRTLGPGFVENELGFGVGARRALEGAENIVFAQRIVPSAMAISAGAVEGRMERLIHDIP